MAFLNTMTAKQRLKLVKSQVSIWLMTTGICLIISLVTWGFGGGSFWVQVRYSYGYGYSIVAIIFLLEHLFNIHRTIASTIGLLIGFAMGSYLLSVSLYDDPVKEMFFNSKEFFTNLVAGFVFSLGVYYYFYTREIMAEKNMQLKEAHLLQLQQEKALVSSQLQVMQSQMEPHFLFNTLANIQGLVDVDPASAKKMLAKLTELLRISLKRSRSDRVSVSEELSLIRAYLDIQQVRMAERLSFEIHQDNVSDQLMIPPYLVQPLVENAVKHGIEPSPEGGHVNIRLHQKNEQLYVEVSDTGIGFNASKGNGVSLQNIRDRLLALYQNQASLDVLEQSGGGVTSKLVLPLEGVDND